MRKIFSVTALLLMILMTTTVFAKESDPENEPYVYTSDDFKYSIACPIKPLAVVRPHWFEPNQKGEMLVFANEGFNVHYAYVVHIDAFDTNEVPDLNKGTVAAIGDYLIALKNNGGFGDANIVNITKKNKGVWAVTAKSFEVIDKETGEVDGEFVADRQDIYTFFRTPEGRCISIQLISANFDKQYLDTYRFSVASFKDNINSKDKKTKKDKDKKKDKKEKKDKKDKKDKKSTKDEK